MAASVVEAGGWWLVAASVVEEGVQGSPGWRLESGALVEAAAAAAAGY